MVTELIATVYGKIIALVLDCSDAVYAGIVKSKVFIEYNLNLAQEAHARANASFLRRVL